MKNFLKRIAAHLPERSQQELKRRYFRSQILGGRFRTDEREYGLLPALVSPKDWVLDIGANIGHYTVRLSDLVGKLGRVIAFEPVPQTFELLAANAALIHPNVTLINAAVSDAACAMGMEIPRFNYGLKNFYMAHLSKNPAPLSVLCIPIDSLALPHRISLVKIDTEGNELSVVKGMVELLRRDHPTLIIEDNLPEVIPFLSTLGYVNMKIDGSSNRIFYTNSAGRPSVGSVIEKQLSQINPAVAPR